MKERKKDSHGIIVTETLRGVVKNDRDVKALDRRMQWAADNKRFTSFLLPSDSAASSKLHSLVLSPN